MARRNDHSRDELRRMSLEAAEAIVTREGAEALSVRRIAQSIGYTHGTLYLVFRNLDGLLLELNGRTLEELAATLDAAAHAAPAGRARLHAVALAYLEFARANRGRWRLLCGHRPTSDDPARDVLGGRVAHGCRVLRDALAEIRPASSSAAVQAGALWSAIHGACVLSLEGMLVDDTGRALEPAAVLKSTVDAFCASAVAEGAP